MSDAMKAASSEHLAQYNRVGDLLAALASADGMQVLTASNDLAEWLSDSPEADDAVTVDLVRLGDLAANVHMALTDARRHGLPTLEIWEGLMRTITEGLECHLDRLCPDDEEG